MGHNRSASEIRADTLVVPLDVDSARGGQRAAVMYSLIVTAKMNDVDP